MKSIRQMSVAALCAASLLGAQVAAAHEGYDRYDRGRHGYSQDRHGPSRHGHPVYGRRVVERPAIVHSVDRMERVERVERRAADGGNVMAGVILGGLIGAVIASSAEDFPDAH